jgi:hypothetical protein
MSEHFPDEPVSAFTVAHTILLRAAAITLAAPGRLLSADEQTCRRPD